MEDQRKQEFLHKRGFTEVEIGRLTELSRWHEQIKQDEADQALIEYRRLSFARWLVSTGKLTDQCA